MPHKDKYSTKMLQPLTADESREFRQFLRDSGYNNEALQAQFAPTEVPQLHLLNLYVHGLPLEASRLNTLFRWFWIGLAVDPATTARFIPERVTAFLLERGVLLSKPEGLASSIRLTPFEQFFIASDHVTPHSSEMARDLVAWPSPTTRDCYHFSFPTSVGRTLDLGTGNGLLGIAAASHSGSVVATDLNSRAREFCLFNAALNGVNNLEFREGSAFEPVQDERFDLILANPPFFVTPTVRHVFSDNSMELDGFCRMLIREAPDHLNENGYCQMLLEWVQMKGQPWRERIGPWFEGLGCDVWVLAGYTRPIADYALIRVQEKRHDPASQAAQIISWLSYFESRQVEAVHGGILTMRRRAGTNWIRLDEMPSEPRGPFGGFLLRVFEARDYLAAHDDEALLDSRPALAASAAMLQRFAISPEGWKLASLDLHLNEGLASSIAIQPQIADFVAMCDGQRTLREIAAQTAAKVKVDPAMVQREACRVVRQFADRGVLLLS